VSESNDRGLLDTAGLEVWYAVGGREEEEESRGWVPVTRSEMGRKEFVAFRSREVWREG
jgi:hypothetical protein